MASNVKRDHHLWTRDTIKNVSGNVTLDIAGDIILDADGGQISMKDGGASHFLFDCDSTMLRIYDDADSGDWFTISVDASGETTISTRDDSAAVGHLIITPDGHTDFRTGTGFPLRTVTYNSVSTIPDFRAGNKAMATFVGGNISSVKMTFPDISGNFLFLLKQDAIGGRTVTSWLAYNSVQNAASTPALKFAGGSNPTLTTDANHVDIISIFWDADNEIAYGAATLDFQF